VVELSVAICGLICFFWGPCLSFFLVGVSAVGFSCDKRWNSFIFDKENPSLTCFSGEVIFSTLDKVFLWGNRENSLMNEKHLSKT
jgi:hypothetical protein